jgi:Putative collagen-binding domain of a collagenase
VLRAGDGSCILAYLTMGDPATMDLDALRGREGRVSWFHPRTGDWSAAVSFASTGRQRFEPPNSGHGQDWVLVLDDASQDVPLA